MKLEYFQIGVLIITAIIVIIKFSKILKWVIPSFEDNKGQASYKRLTAFSLLTLDSYLIIANKVDTSIMLNVHYSLLAAMLLTAAIITTENIITVFGIIKGTISKDTDPEVKKIEGEVKISNVG